MAQQTEAGRARLVHGGIGMGTQITIYVFVANLVAASLIVWMVFGS